MSIEDDAKRELERRERNELLQKQNNERIEKQKKLQREQQNAKMLARDLEILKPLKIEPLLEEIRDKYWGTGKISRYEYADGWQETYIRLFVEFEGVGSGTTDWEGSTEYYKGKMSYSIKVSLKYITEEVIEFRVDSHYPSRAYSLSSSRSEMSHYSRKQFSIKNGRVENKEEVFFWIRSQLAEYVIKITDGQVGKKSNIIADIYEQAKKDIDHYNYQRGIPSNDNKGCWPFNW